MTGVGFALTNISALMGLIHGDFFQARWIFLTVGPVELELGTPQLFDLGVFLVVMSVVVSYLLSLGPSGNTG